MTRREPPPGWGAPPPQGPAVSGGATPPWPPVRPALARPTSVTAASVVLLIEAVLLYGVAALLIVVLLGTAVLSVADAPPQDLGARLGRLTGALIAILGAYPTVVLVLAVRLRQPGRRVDWWLAAALQALTVALFAAAAIAAGGPGHPTERPLAWPERVLLGAVPAALPAAACACLLAGSTRRFHHVGRRVAG